MDNNYYYNSSIKKLQSLGINATLDEKQTISNMITKFNPASANVSTPGKILDALVRKFYDEIAKKRSIEVKTDLGGYMMKEILSHTEDAIDVDNVRRNTDINNKIGESSENITQVSSILGLKNNKEIQRLFNPLALERKTTIVLDRRFQSRNINDNIEFSWNIARDDSVYDIENTIKLNVPIKNIRKIRVLPFRFPNTENAITASRRISMTIKEFQSQAIFSSEDKIRYHFLFGLELTNQNVYSTAPYILRDIDQYETGYTFYTPINELKTLTISFGNPFRKLILDPDILSGTLSSDASDTKIVFPQPHYLTTDDIVIISDFNTDEPGADLIPIGLMNNPYGWRVAVVNSTTVKIDVDISGLVGTIIDNPIDIYLDAKRFIIPLELTFLD